MNDVMIIQVSPLAESRLNAMLGDRPGYFKLFYDTDGCGCDGTAVLLIVNEPDSDDIRIESDSLPFLINKQQQIYFEPCLRLQSENSFPSYRLSSDSMIYGNHVKAHDLRDTADTSPQPLSWFVR
ncbi:MULTISPECIES: iron-sulfur cluster biosynthesis family protein [Paenibacillus]|nr:MULTISPECIES: iron-sulfur cluster biosynthesis family protein [Paenibacillus]MDR9747447.1 iron-sulfur cluster biosynthesis family protein [Paenibacillus taichungensis]MEC0108649.1 iron-sulfur cluster biosynthesis family protein [Paenibacillus taichungensis]MEC0196149.1 iron-sulfur cluster biosynthesis family protein [Paenibacillus taichungensis]